MMPQSLTHRRYEKAVAQGGSVWLDSHQLLTPAQNKVEVPPPLAAAIASEWDTQGDKINPAQMPMTQLAFTAIDRVAPQREMIAGELMNYLETELICHYGDTPELVAWQKRHWQELHQWLNERFGVTLPVTAMIQPLRAVQDQAWAAGYMAGLDTLRLTALQQAVAVTSSLVIGMALVDGKISASAALDAAEAEGDWQADKWGRDPEFTARRMGQLTDLEAVERFVALLA